MKHFILLIFILLTTKLFAVEKQIHELTQKNLHVTINDCTNKVTIHKLVIDLNINGGHGSYTIATPYIFPILKKDLSEDEWILYSASSVLESSGVETEIEIDNSKNGKASIKFGIFYEETGINFYRQKINIQTKSCK